MDDVLPTIDDLKSIFDIPKNDPPPQETKIESKMETKVEEESSPFVNPTNDVSADIKTITPELTDEEVTQRLKDAENSPEVAKSGESEIVSPQVEEIKTKPKSKGGSIKDFEPDYKQTITKRDKLGRILEFTPKPIKPESKGGRKTVMTPEVLEDLRQAYLMGANDEQAAEYVNIHRSTLSDYKALHPEFSDNIDAWRTNPIMKAKVTIYHNLDDPRIAAWYAERKAKDEFSTRSEVTGKDGEDLPPIRIEYVKPSDTVRTSKDSLRSDTETGSSMDVVNGSDNK